jgi:hypothetical protein
MTFDQKADRTILRLGGENGVFDIAVAGKINKALNKNYSVITLRKRYEILKRQDFTGKLIPDQKPVANEKNTILIPAVIKHKYDANKPETFVDEDRVIVHMHNLFAELVAVAKELVATEKERLGIDRLRMEIQQEQLNIQREQLTIQNAMFIKATEKK